MMTLFLFSRNVILTFTMSFMCSSEYFFCLIQGTNGENETDRMIVKVETILGYNLNDAAF